ncbi:MAG TPA: type II toxin-antitoxin system Phd/YefM family antitoxin [Anaerolineae bacterium]|jgi:prevent-host-death family protein
MNPTRVSIDEFRTKLADFVGRVMYGSEAVVVTKYNRQVAVLISTAEYERLLDPTKRLSKRQWQAQVRKLETARRQVKDMDPDELQALVDKGVADVRSSKLVHRA